MARLRYKGAVYDCLGAETVLDALLRHEVPTPHACRNGVCMSCVLRCVRGRPPERAQRGLKDTLRAQGHFLACQCTPTEDLEIAAADDAALYDEAIVQSVDRFTATICRLRLRPPADFAYRAGQFINLRCGGQASRSYSLASLPGADEFLELHVKRIPDGRVSGYIFERLAPGDTVEIQGPNGDCFYLPGRPEQPMLLIGSGSGLAPLFGIARDALGAGHGGEIRLYHGSRRAGGLYLGDELRELADRHAGFAYSPCLSGDTAAGDAGNAVRRGRASDVALVDQPDLSGWRVYLCGLPEMVHSARRGAYLAGAGLDDIYADAFDFRAPVQVPDA